MASRNEELAALDEDLAASMPEEATRLLKQAS